MKKISKGLAFGLTYILSTIISMAACPDGFLTVGTGTEKDPYIISNNREFTHINNCKENKAGIYFKQVANLGNERVTPIEYFRASYDGNNLTFYKHFDHLFGRVFGTVKNLKIVSIAEDSYPPILDLDIGSYLTNIEYINPNFIYRPTTSTTDSIGILVEGMTSGTIDRVSVVANVYYNRDIYIDERQALGGITGMLGTYGSINNSYTNFNFDIKYRGSDKINVGGFIGEANYGKVSNSYTTYNVTGDTHIAVQKGIMGSPRQGSVTASNVYYDNRKESYPDFGIPVSLDYMKTDDLVNKLNGTQSPRVWKRGNSSYPYPMLFKNDLKLSISTLNTSVGDNTPISLSVSAAGEDYNAVNSFRVIDSRTGNILSNSPLNNLISFNTSEGTFNVFVQALDSDNNILKTSNILAIDKNNILAKLVDSLNAQNGLDKTIIVNDTNRYFEDNAINRDLVGRLKGFKNIFLIYTDVSPVLIPMLEK